MTISLAADVLLSHTVHFLSLLFLYHPPKYPPFNPVFRSSISVTGPSGKAWPPHCSSLEPSISAGLSTAPLADVGSSCGVYLEFVWRKDPLNIPLSANKVTSDLLKLAMKEMHFYKSTVFLSPILRLSPALACAGDPIMGILSMWRTQWWIYIHTFIPLWLPVCRVHEVPMWWSLKQFEPSLWSPFSL